MARNKLRPLRDWVELLVEQAVETDADAREVLITLKVLAQAQRSLVPCGPEVDAGLAHRTVFNLSAAAEAARATLLRAHEQWRGAKDAIRELDRSRSADSDCGGAPSGFDLFAAEEEYRLALHRASTARTQAATELQKTTAALRDGLDTGRMVAAGTAKKIFDLIADRMQDDVALVLCRFLLCSTSDAREKEVIYDFMITLVDLPETERRKFALAGLHDIPRARVASKLGRFFRRGRDDFLYDLLLGENRTE